MNDNIDAYVTRYNGFVQQLPNETFLQISNCESDIAFGGNLLIELIDICQQVVKILEVGENFFLNEFTDINGIKQIAYEFGNIGEDYYQELLFLRLTHTVSDNYWVSSGFFITERLKRETTRFEYKNNGYFRGISYDNQPYFQTIRLACFKNDFDTKIDSETYTQISGAEITLRPIITPVDKYLFYTCDFFTYKRLVTLLNHDLIYIDAYKITNKPAPTKGDRIEDTNIFDARFEANPSDDFRAFQYQIYQPLAPITLDPINNSSMNSTTGLFSIGFNKTISIGPGTTAKLYENGTLVSTITPTAATNILSLDFSSHAFINTTYSIVIDPNSIFHSLEYWAGFAFGDWQFAIAETLTINSITNIGVKIFHVDYTSTSTPTNLHYQISYDGINWLTPVAFTSTTNPLTINTIASTDDFYVRLVDVMGVNVYSNVMQFITSSCVVPTLTNVVKNMDGSLTFNWNTNGFTYTGGIANIQYSIDGGTTWVSNAEDPSLGTYTIHPTGLITGMAIKYKIVFTGGGCSMMQTNIISTTY